MRERERENRYLFSALGIIPLKRKCKEIKRERVRFQEFVFKISFFRILYCSHLQILCCLCANKIQTIQNNVLKQFT